MWHEIYRQPVLLLTRLRDFPSIPGYDKIILGYPGTGIHPHAVDFTVDFGGRPAVLGPNG